MNPGPHGMGQMGIPFSATSVVRDLLGIKGRKLETEKSASEKATISGLDWHKEEVSGTRIWNLLEEHYGV